MSHSILSLFSIICDARMFHLCAFLFIQNLKIRQRDAYSLLWRSNFNFAFKVDIGTLLWVKCINSEKNIIEQTFII